MAQIGFLWQTFINNCKYLLLFLISASARAEVGSPFELKELYLEHHKFNPGGRNPLINKNGLGKTIDREVSLYFNLGVFKYAFFDNQIYSLVDRNYDQTHSLQFRLIGWKADFGIHLFSFLDIGAHHFSKHQLDHNADNYLGKFPVEDSWFVRINFFIDKKIKDSNPSIF